MRTVRMLVVVLVLLAGLAAGCARRVPLTELGPAGAPVGVVLTTVTGEELSGRLLSFGDGKMVLEAVLGPVVSFFLGPLVGALLALTF